MSAREVLARMVHEHRPAVELCPLHGYHVVGCTCGQDPLDFEEHLVNRILAEGVCTYAAAADVVEDEMAEARSRLSTAERPDPHEDPGNAAWLGGFYAAAAALRAKRASP